MDGRSGHRQEQIELAGELREQGHSWTAISAALRSQYGVNARVAMRLAHGWGQADVAAEWNRRWPNEPKTFKNISYWENWPSRTGYAPSLTVLDRLAQLYECDVTDLLAGWGVHRGAATPRPEATSEGLEPAMLAWQVEHLDSEELTRAVDDWPGRLPDKDRRSLLLKLSAAAAVAASETAPEGTRPVLGAAPSPTELAGLWTSTYGFHSTGRNAEFSHTHQIGLRAERGKLIGRSLATETGTVELELAVDGLLVSGTWTEYTSPAGYYLGAVYHGILQLVLDPTGRSLAGRWLGPDKQFAINSGPWTLTRSPATGS